MINQTSRYVDDSISIVTSPGRSTHQSINKAMPTTKQVNFTWYQWEEGDTIDFISFQLFGAGQDWWKIADVNPEILDWMLIPTGTLIRIPYAL